MANPQVVASHSDSGKAEMMRMGNQFRIALQQPICGWSRSRTELESIPAKIFIAISWMPQFDSSIWKSHGIALDAASRRKMRMIITMHQQHQLQNRENERMKFQCETEWRLIGPDKIKLFYFFTWLFGNARFLLFPASFADRQIRLRFPRNSGEFSAPLSCIACLCYWWLHDAMSRLE